MFQVMQEFEERDPGEYWRAAEVAIAAAIVLARDFARGIEQMSEGPGFCCGLDKRFAHNAPWRRNTQSHP